MAKATPKKATVTKAASRPRASGGHDASSGDASRLIPLANGRFAYVCYPRGASVRLATDSPSFADMIAKMAADGMGPRLHSDITGFAEKAPNSAWPSVLASLEAADVFGS